MTAPTAEESRALLEPEWECRVCGETARRPDQPLCGECAADNGRDVPMSRVREHVPGLEAHLRAALDREAALIAERDAALVLATMNWEGWCAEVIERKRIEAERDAARAEVERLRPVWAQGWSSDSVAAQVSSAALSQIWELLGATSQTEVMQTLRAALDRESALIADRDAARAEAERLRRAEDRLFDLLLGDDGQAVKEAERYLERHRPDLYGALPEEPTR